MTTTLTITSGQTSFTAQGYTILPSPGTAVPDNLAQAILSAANTAGVVLSSSAGTGVITVPSRRFNRSGVGPPVSGEGFWLLGDEIVDSAGTEYECSAPGNPGTWTTAQSGTFESRGSLGYKLRRTAIRAAARKGVAAVELGVMSTPPTITTNNTNTWGTGLSTRLYWTTGSSGLFSARGGTPTVTSTNYVRFPVVTLPTGTGNATTSPTNRNAYGWSVEFMSDAPLIDIQVLNGAGKTARILIDGQPVGASGLAYPASSGDGIFNLDWSGVRKVRHYRFEGNGDAGWRGVGIDSYSSVWKPDSELDIKVATLGDSVCGDTGATDPNGGWQHQFGKLVGLSDIRQVGLGASGLVNTGTFNSTHGDATRLADLVEINPDVILLMASVNDQGKTAGAVQTAALAAFRLWRTNFPNALIVAAGLWPGSGNNSAQQQTVENEVAAAYATFSASDSKTAPFVPIITDTIPWCSGTGFVGSTSGSGNSNVYNQDASHPNQAGHQYLAERWARAWRTSILPAVAS